MKQWKRLAALSSAIVMAAATLTYFPNDTLQNIRWEISASAEDASAVTWTKTESDGLTWTLDADGTLTISGTGAMKDYNYDSNPSPASQKKDSTKKVVIEDGVTSIGEKAFSGCKSLTSITIPDSVTSIGNGAFSYTGLKSITIPGNVESIGESAFYSCDNLTDVTLQDGVKSIGNAAFIWCNNLTNIVLSNSITSIGYWTFKDCTSLTSIKIPSSVTSIDDPFYNCSSLKTISLDCGSSLKRTDFGEQADLVSYTNQHLLTKTAAKDATCTENGNKEYWTCEHCGKYFLSDDTNPETAKAVELSETVIPASHKLTKVEAKDATCSEDGNKEYWTCEHCGKYFLSDDANPETAKAVELSETVIPASHKLTKVEEKDATCAENGNKEYWTCEHCGKYFLSDDTNPETAKAVELSETILPAIQHKNAELRNASEPTETSPGYSGDLYCPDCDKVVEKGYTYWNEGNLTWKLYADGTLNISGTGAMKDYNATDNLSPAYNNSKVKKIVIEDGVTSIGDIAFSYCRSLTSITIPDSVTSIEFAAFNNCSSLTSITIPDSVTNIEDCAFEWCSSLSNITLPNNITSIGTGVFHGCSSLTSITIPDGVTSIGNNAFDSCSSLTSITIPDSVTSIGGFTFKNCSSLTSIMIPDGVTSIGNSAFKNCSSLTDITIPDSVTSIGSFAFYNCSSLKTISLSCKSTLKKSNFGEQANLVSYTNQHLLTKTEAKDATCAESGNKEYWTCKHCGKYFLSDDANPATATAVELSETVIPALNHKNATTRGAVKPTETEPGYSGDLYCPDCDTVLEKGYTYWNEGNLTWKLDADGTLTISGTGAMKNYDSKKNRNPVYNNSNVKTVVIEDGVTSIGNYAFTYCVSLTSITIPDSVTSIGYYAFFYCKSLTSITIPDSVTSIGNYAFFYCRNLTSITIPDSVTSIGNDAFSNCRSLTSITIPDSVTSIGYNAFYGCSNLKTISLSCKSSLKRSDFGGQADLVSYTSHTLTKTEAKAATCTEDGNKEYWTCEYCKKYFLSDDTNPETAKAVEQSETVIPASHKLTKVDAKAVTCAENGNKEYWTCEHCGKYFLSDDANPETAKAVEQSETIIPASHKLTKVEAKAATCSEDGNKAYWTCEHCGKYFLSDDTNPATAKAVELSETITPALKHKNAITRGKAKPTETAPGYSGDLYCPDCDTVLKKGYTYWNEDNLTWKLDADGTMTISGTGAMKDYDYDSNLSPVCKNSNVKKVVIEDGVTSIGDSAFESCTNLTDITIPDSVTSIGNSAFAYTGLKSITIPDSVTNIGNYAFFYTGLKSITIPDSVTSIENGTFYNCSSLTDIVIPNSVTSIKTAAFSYCRSLTSITIPDSVTSIGSSAFSECRSLTSITIPDSVTSIGKYAFENCSSLKSITIPDSVTSIGNAVFKNCSSLQTISLSCKSSLKKSDFGDQADLVSYASHILKKTAAKAKTCTEDGNKEYWTCEHCGKYFLSDDSNPETAKAVELSETVIPASHKLTKVEAKDATCTEDGNKEYWTCEHCKKYFLSDDTNPETAKAVELSETILPAIQHKNAELRNASEPTETSPGYSGDLYCPDCDKVVEKGYTYWNEGNLTWKLDADGTLTISGTGAMKDYNADDNPSPVYKNSNVKKIVIENSVTSIGELAFYKCSSLTNITIPGNVESIGESAFYSCDNLTDVTLQDGVKSIGNAAFIWCNNLTNIVLPNSVTSIGYFAFKDCTSLTSIKIPDSVTSIGSSAFENCSSLTSITIPDSVTVIAGSAFENCSSLTSITIPDSVTVIGRSAFANCSSLKTISLSCKSSLKKDDFGEQADLVSYTNQHLLTKTAAKDATCTESGNKEYWTCEHCGKYFLSDDANPETAKAVELSETVIPASHKLTKVDAKAATCTEDGNKEYWTCEHCKKYFLSDDTNPETAKAVELSETVIPALVQVATVTTPIKCVYGQDMSKIDLRDYVKNTDVVGEVTVKVATGSALPDGMKLDGSKLSGKPAKAYEDGREVTFTFTAENGSTENLTLLFLVEKADPTVEVAVSGDSHTEGDLVKDLELILSENSTKGVVEIVSEIKALVAGKNTFTWKFTPEDENNYNTITGTVVVNAQTTTTTTTTTKATTTTTKVTTTTKPSKTTTTKVTTTTKPSKTTTTKVTTTTKPSKTTTTKVTTTTKPSKTTTTKVTTTTKPSKTTTTKVTTTTKPSKTTTTKVTTTTKPSKTTTTKVTTTTKPSKTTTTKVTTTTVTTTTKPSKTTTTNATTTNTAIPSYGDVNLDGKVDIVDAIFLNKYLATLIQFSDAQVANADCCQDGVLNAQDTTALMQFIILLIDDLPVQPTEK